MINNITLMGRLTKDPEYNITTTNTPVVNFTLAVQRTYSQDKEADFIDCTAWSGTADFIHKYFTKGQMLALQGRVRTDPFTDKEGNKRKSFKVVVHECSFCDSKNK